MSRKKRSPIWTRFNDKDFTEIVQQSTSIAEIQRKILNKTSVRGGNHIVWARINALNIDASHIQRGLGSNRGKQPRNKIPLNEVISGKCPHYQTRTLKQRLFDEGYKENKCEECGQESTWNNKPLVLQLDHVNGDHKDHRLDNLRIMCPNCHTQTVTWGNKKR